MSVEFDAISTREAFGNALADLGAKNDRIMYLARIPLKT